MCLDTNIHLYSSRAKKWVQLTFNFHLSERKNGCTECKKTCSIWPSRVVPHRSTTQTRSCLTALFGWEAVTQDDMAACDICGIFAIFKCSNIMDRRFGSAELHPPSGVGWWEKTETRKRRGGRGGWGGAGPWAWLRALSLPAAASLRRCGPTRDRATNRTRGRRRTTLPQRSEHLLYFWLTATQRG